MAVKYILGLDQGGSKTHAAISDEYGHILGVGKAHGGCHSVNGMDYAAEGMLLSAELACKDAGISVSDIDRIGAGLTGVDWDFEGPLLQNKLSELFSVPIDRIHVVNDCLIALRAASSKPSGCILCAGSALNCGVRKDASHEYVYGYYIEDGNQGGGALGARVVQAVLDAESMLRPKTALTEPVLEYVGCTSADDMLFKRVNKQLPHEKVLRLPEVLEQVVRSAGESDEAKVRNVARLANGDLCELRRLMAGATDDVRHESFEMFCSLMRFSYNDRHLELITWAEELAQLTREQQLSFLRHSARLLRESYVMHAGALGATYLWGEEAAFCNKFAPFIGSRNIEPLIGEIETAMAQIGQNGNPKIVFTHFALAVSKYIARLQ